MTSVWRGTAHVLGVIQSDANIGLLGSAQRAAEGVEEKELCGVNRLLREFVVSEIARPRGKMPGGKVSMLLGGVVTGHEVILSCSRSACL